MSSIPYHRSEFAIAIDEGNPQRVMPTVLPRHERILDVGCGIGQTLFALGLSPSVEAYGIDCDEDAIVAGRRMACELRKKQILPFSTLRYGSGESIPFPDNYFDLVICRVSLPYMRINKALSEMSRVLKPGGDLWMTLHSKAKVTERMQKHMDAREIRSALSCGFTLANGWLFDLTGLQMSLFGKCETYQTPRRMVMALSNAGLNCTKLQTEGHFVMEAKKLA